MYYSHAINNPAVVRVAFDVGFRRGLGGLANITHKYGPRPDVLLGFKNGAVRAIEVASKTDISRKLIQRNDLKIAQEGLSSSGTVVSYWAVRINKIFGN